MRQDKHSITSTIKATAEKLGFSGCGIAPAGPLEKEGALFRQWVEDEHHAGMEYMARNVEKRLNPKLLEPWTRSVIVCLYNYYPGDEYKFSSNYKISKYAYGKDYHQIVKDKLHLLKQEIQKIHAEMKSRVFTDSAPVMERAWAVRAGLGWTGKNACLINKGSGSYFFIGIILTDLELVYDKPYEGDHCGSCTRCIDICPGKAIIAPGVVNAGKCISYLTIEHKGDFADNKQTQFHEWIFGCDACQDICPWNRYATAHNEPAFRPAPKLLAMTDMDWNKLDSSTFNELFRGTAVERTGYDAIQRNIEQGKKKME